MKIIITPIVFLMSLTAWVYGGQTGFVKRHLRFVNFKNSP